MSMRNGSQLSGILAFLTVVTLLFTPSAYCTQEDVYRASVSYRVLGVWQVSCCGNTLHWKLNITQQQGSSFSGTFSDNDSGGVVRGQINGSRIEFERSGNWGKQLWTAELVSMGTTMKMVKGSWKGSRQEAHKNDFHAEKIYDKGDVKNDGKSSSYRVLGVWRVSCCGDALHWKLNITRQQGNGFSGTFSDNDSGGVVKGQINGNRIEFERSGSWGRQLWTAELVSKGTTMKMVKGSWKGSRQEAHRNDFHAEKQ